MAEAIEKRLQRVEFEMREMDSAMKEHVRLSQEFLLDALRKSEARLEERLMQRVDERISASQKVLVDLILTVAERQENRIVERIGERLATIEDRLTNVEGRLPPNVH